MKYSTVKTHLLQNSLNNLEKNDEIYFTVIMKASKPQSLKASKPQSLKASKPQSLKASIFAA